MSTLESADMVYLQQHADGESAMYNIGLSGEQLEQRRVAAMGSSALGEILDRVFMQLDESNLGEVVEAARQLLL